MRCAGLILACSHAGLEGCDFDAKVRRLRFRGILNTAAARILPEVTKLAG